MQVHRNLSIFLKKRLTVQNISCLHQSHRQRLFKATSLKSDLCAFGGLFYQGKHFKTIIRHYKDSVLLFHYTFS